MQSGQQGPHGLIGSVIGGYRLEKILGSGATGAVFLGQQVGNTAELVAIKVLMLPPQTSDAERAEFRARFLREAQVLFQLRHPHILPIHGYGEDPATGYDYMVLPYLTGGTFADRLKQGPLPLDWAAAYAGQIADALDYAHARGIVHRDVKPANILLDANGQPYLADFGVARLFDALGAGMTTTGTVLGTAAYMSPEQVLGEHAGPAADVYSLGIVLYQMVTGRVPFDGAIPSKVMLQHVQAAPPPPRMARPDLPPPAEAVILRALAKQPQDRFPSAGALAQAFAFGLQGHWPAPTYGPQARGEATISDFAPPRTVMASAPQPGGSGGRQRNLFLQLGIATIAVLIVALLLVNNTSAIGAALFGARGAASPTTRPTTPAGATATARSTTPPGSRALVPTGSLLYSATAPGICDSDGGNWAQNPSAVQICDGGGLVLSGPDCPCPLGVVALASMPQQPAPQDYVIQVRATSLGTDPTAFYGFKFRQQTLQDTASGRGGYAFLFAQNRKWEYNEYTPNGTRNILVAQTLPFALGATNTLDLVVSGTSFAFYINGRLVAQQNDSTYSQGYFCLVAEPGAHIRFQNLAVYAPAS